MMNFIFHGVTKRFGGVTALDGVACGIQGGVITALIGPNGSGKTTLTNVATGMTSLDEGALMIGDRSFGTMHPWQMRTLGVTRTFQAVRIFEQMTVLDNILVVHSPGILASFLRAPQEKDRSYAYALLERFNLSEKANEYARVLSYGQRKLLELARTSACSSELFFFDEPFAGLSRAMTEIAITYMEQLRSMGKTVVLIEHNMELIRRLADHVIVMDAGTILAEGTFDEMIARVDVRLAYLGE